MNVEWMRCGSFGVGGCSGIYAARKIRAGRLGKIESDAKHSVMRIHTLHGVLVWVDLYVYQLTPSGFNLSSCREV